MKMKFLKNIKNKKWNFRNLICQNEFIKIWRIKIFLKNNVIK